MKSPFLNKAEVTVAIFMAINVNLKGEADKKYTDSLDIAKSLVIKFVDDLAAALEKRFEN
jgi:hypothetical protein